MGINYLQLFLFLLTSKTIQLAISSHAVHFLLIIFLFPIGINCLQSFLFSTATFISDVCHWLNFVFIFPIGRKSKEGDQGRVWSRKANRWWRWGQYRQTNALCIFVFCCWPDNTDICCGGIFGQAYFCILLLTRQHWHLLWWYFWAGIFLYFVVDQTTLTFVVVVFLGRHIFVFCCWPDNTDICCGGIFGQAYFCILLLTRQHWHLLWWYFWAGIFLSEHVNFLW